MFSGFLNIHKPLGITSHDVVNNVRRLTIRDFQSKKVGHAGTLDPLAEGVLIVCVGDATRLSDYVMHQTKVYRAKIHLGIETETYDAEGQIVSSVDATHVSRDAIEKALRAFVGDIQQVPPIYSAIKKTAKNFMSWHGQGRKLSLNCAVYILNALHFCLLSLLLSRLTLSVGLAHISVVSPTI